MSQQGPGMFKAEAKQPIDVVVRRHDYAAGGSTGWHSHPYPVFVTSSRDRSRSTTTTTRAARQPWSRRVRDTSTRAAATLAAERDCSAGLRHQRDHGAGGCAIPGRACGPGALLRLLTLTNVPRAPPPRVADGRRGGSVRSASQGSPDSRTRGGSRSAGHPATRASA